MHIACNLYTCGFNRNIPCDLNFVCWYPTLYARDYHIGWLSVFVPLLYASLTRHTRCGGTLRFFRNPYVRVMSLTSSPKPTTQVTCHAPASSKVRWVVIELSNCIGTHTCTPNLATIPNPLSKSTSPGRNVGHCTKSSTIPLLAQVLTLKVFNTLVVVGSPHVAPPFLLLPP